MLIEFVGWLSYSKQSVCMRYAALVGLFMIDARRYERFPNITFAGLVDDMLLLSSTKPAVQRGTR